MNPVMRLVRNPLNYRMVGHFIRTSTYPFPWLLGDFPNIGYYEKNNSPGKFDADFLVVQEDRIAEVEKKLHESYFTEPMTIRPYQDTSKLYLNARTFRKFFPAGGLTLSARLHRRRPSLDEASFGGPDLRQCRHDRRFVAWDRGRRAGREFCRVGAFSRPGGGHLCLDRDLAVSRPQKIVVAAAPLCLNRSAPGAG